MNLLFGGLNFYLRLCSILFNFIMGGGVGGVEHCTVQSVSLCFARLNFIWGGRLKPPQALMTRRP